MLNDILDSILKILNWCLVNLVKVPVAAIVEFFKGYLTREKLQSYCDTANTPRNPNGLFVFDNGNNNLELTTWDRLTFAMLHVKYYRLTFAEICKGKYQENHVSFYSTNPEPLRSIQARVRAMTPNQLAQALGPLRTQRPLAAQSSQRTPQQAVRGG